jgi:hypothetical protein
VKSVEDALALFPQVHSARRRLGQIHMLAMGLATQASSRFIDLCKSRFGPEGELIATDLMGGFSNRSLDSAKGLWTSPGGKGLPWQRAVGVGESMIFLEQFDKTGGGGSERGSTPTSTSSATATSPSASSHSSPGPRTRASPC